MRLRVPWNHDDRGGYLSEPFERLLNRAEGDAKEGAPCRAMLMALATLALRMWSPAIRRLGPSHLDRRRSLDGPGGK